MNINKVKINILIGLVYNKKRIFGMRKKMLEEEKKQKITFSINEKLKELVDNQIEKEGIKRSQLIERILKEHFEKNNNK